MCIFTNTGFLIQNTSTLQTALSESQRFSGRIGYILFLCNKYFDQNLPDALALAAFTTFGLFYQSRDLQLLQLM